jgi:UDP-glucose 4-epimerase
MVFFVAAAVGVKLIVERPVHTIETNVHGTEGGAPACQQEREARRDFVDLRGLRQEL